MENTARNRKRIATFETFMYNTLIAGSILAPQIELGF